MHSAKFPDKLRIEGSQKIIGPFANETEEANWWYDNREWFAEDYIRAADAGRVRINGKKITLTDRTICLPYTDGKQSEE